MEEDLGDVLVKLSPDDFQRLMIKFAQAADFTTEQDRRIYDILFAIHTSLQGRAPNLPGDE